MSIWAIGKSAAARSGRVLSQKHCLAPVSLSSSPTAFSSLKAFPYSGRFYNHAPSRQESQSSDYPSFSSLGTTRRRLPLLPSNSAGRSFHTFSGTIAPALVRPYIRAAPKSCTPQHIANMATNGVSTRSSKRKQEEVKSERPMKQRKPEPVEEEDEHMSVDGDSMSPRAYNGVESESEDELHVNGKVAAVAETKEWQATIERVVSSAVSIHFCQTCSFDTDPALASEATGFVVDAERGYILTNRHVVGAGPFTGYVIFDNHEEVDVFPVYRDPVHDFGILRFDPKAVKYMKLHALQLRPDLAKVGSEIRVVGNDAGEKLSILSGVISRLDRNAPEYGEGYSDFNTNYIQAAAAATGGSSGSPVVDIDGFAIALQAGGRADGASTDYFLPLDRPLRALKCIQEGKTVTRGTIQTQWLIKPFDECRRLGLSPEWEAEMRKEFPKETGLLVAELILPEGPGHKYIEEGDVLIKVNGQLLTKFTLLDAILDDSVGSKVKILVQRGGKDVEVELTVGDLHAITPDRFVSVAGGSFHALSYQQARLYGVAVKGVYVCETGGSFRFEGVESGWIVDTVDNKETPDLDIFVKVMQGVPDRTRIIVSYKHLRDLHTQHTSVILVDRHWSKKMRLAVRNDVTGLWDFTDLGDPLPPPAPVRRSANFVRLDGTQYPEAADIIRSFVRVTVSMPVKLDGFPRARKNGHGLVIDAEKGLVIVSRAILPYDLCDVSVHVAESIIVEAKVVFLHPLQNYAIIKYDPSLVDAPIKSAKLATETIKQGSETIFFGWNQNMRPVIAKTSVTDITTVGIPASAATPRYRAINLDAVTVDTSLASQCGSGVLLSSDGTVQALWLTYLGERNSHNNKDVEYHLGLATPMLLPVLAQVQKGVLPSLRILNVETSTTTMSQARIMGLEDSWIQRVQAEDPERHQLFIVRKVDSGHDLTTSNTSTDTSTITLREADIILTIDDRLCTRVSDLDVMYERPVLSVLVLRKRQLVTLTIPTIPTDQLETNRALIFCGAVLQPPHHAVRQQIKALHSHVYISGRLRGSPAYMYGLAPTNFITHVNAVPTPDLSAFVKEVNKIPDNTYFRLRVVTFDNVPWVATLKKNEHYFPMLDWIKTKPKTAEGDVAIGGEEGWRRVTYEEGGMGAKHDGVDVMEGEVVDQGMGDTGVDGEA